MYSRCFPSFNLLGFPPKSLDHYLLISLSSFSSPFLLDLSLVALSVIDSVILKILTLKNLPKKLDDWYEWVTKLDHQWRRMQRAMG